MQKLVVAQIFANDNNSQNKTKLNMNMTVGKNNEQIVVQSQTWE